MRFSGQFKQKVIAFLGASMAFAVPGIAQAKPHILPVVINLQLPQTWLTMASANSLCVSMIYDQNGNRLSQAVTSVTTTTTTWGTASYGCFVWKQ